MRPLRLSITAFGPYPGTEVVDFDALTELGLFVVAGNNGAGKTTIFDALHYSLFGTLPGRRANYVRLKSDHADDTAECQVTLDFVAHGKQWRVERSPKQKRPKRRGTGVTEVDRRATLYRLDSADQAVAVANKIGEVDQQCRQLVGLSGKQFERVALLPQGEFSRVLRESSTDRRELLRTLFSSEIFGDATTLLSEDAALATAADRSIFDRLDHQQASLAESLGTLTGQSVANTTADLQQAIADFRRVRLAKLATQASEQDRAAKQAVQEHQNAVDTCRRISRRAQVEQAHQAHHQAAPQHQADLHRLERGRAAVPVANLVRSVAEQQQRNHVVGERVSELQRKLTRALSVAGITPLDHGPSPSQAWFTQTSASLTELSQQLHARSEAAVRVNDLDALVKRSQADLRRVANETGDLAQQMNIAEAQHRQLDKQQQALATAADIDECTQTLRALQAQLHQRTELASLETDLTTLGQQAIELDAKVAQTRAEFERASQAQSSLGELQTKADAAFIELEACTKRSASAKTFTLAAAALRTSRSEYQAARAHADELWDAFIAGTAARVATALVDDEPCPVCGSQEHPSPATAEPGGHVVSQADVTAARLRVDQLHEQVRSTETQIEALRSTHEDIASLSPADAAAQITTAKAMALGARTRADDARRCAAAVDQLAGELDHASDAHAKLDAEQRGIDQRCNQLRGALGELAHVTVASLRSQVDDTNQALTTATQRAARSRELAQAITVAAQDIETIGLGQIAAKARHSASLGQLEDRQHELGQATSLLESLDSGLTTTSNESTPAAHYEQRAQAARHGLELVGELTTAVALQQEVADGIRRASSLLHDRIHQSPFSCADDAMAAFVEPDIISQLEQQTIAFTATSERLQGQLQELVDLPDTPPDQAALLEQANQATQAFSEANRLLITSTGTIDRLSDEVAAIVEERKRLDTTDVSTRRLERVAALVKGDNDRNTSLENWVLAAHLRDVVELANIRLARSTHQRFQLCVLDDGENKRGRWGLDLGVEDTVTGTRRPTAGLSGGELFQASLALALGLADAVMNQTAGVSIDALFIDEGFGALDDVSVERAIDLLDELRDRGAMVGVITHVPALLDALPLGVHVIDSPDGTGSTISQTRLAA